MKEFLAQILGEYVAPTYNTYVSLEGIPMPVEVIPDGLAGIDWLYVLSGLAFIMVLYCVLRLIGGMLCKNF